MTLYQNAKHLLGHQVSQGRWVRFQVITGRIKSLFKKVSSLKKSNTCKKGYKAKAHACNQDCFGLRERDMAAQNAAGIIQHLASML